MYELLQPEFCLFHTQLVPGETALAFYKAKNPTDKPVIGISTYNVVPYDAGQYFNKIQVSTKSNNVFTPYCWAKAFGFLPFHACLCKYGI